jgi:peptide/nickel transport system substrate-binding protein
LEEPVFKKYRKEKEGYSKNSLYTTDPTNVGLYNGPYVVKEMKLGSHVVLTPNKHFYGVQPKIQKVILKLIPNTGTLEANLRSGQIDMISVLGMSFDQALAFEKKVKKEKLPYDVKFRQSLTYEHIDLQFKNEILQDIKVRKALVHAIDRDQLVKALFEGKQFKAIHNLAPIDPWYTKDPKKIVLYKYSRRKAKKLLDEAGWKLGKDGFRYKDGKKLTLLLMTTAGNKVRELVEQYLQNEWKKVGIDIQIKNEPARVYFGETVHKAKYPAMAMYAWISSPENTPRSTMHSSNIPSAKNSYSGQNSGGWNNKEVDRLIEAIDLEFDAKKRLDLVHKLAYQYTNEVPVIPLYYRAEVAVSPKNMTGHTLTGTQFSATNHVEKWSLE